MHDWRGRLPFWYNGWAWRGLRLRYLFLTIVLLIGSCACFLIDVIKGEGKRLLKEAVA